MNAPELLSEELAISERLVSARSTGLALPGFPGEVPDGLVQSYRIQARSIDRWPDAVAGWKVGGIPPAFQEKFAAQWLRGPIFAKSVKRAAGTIAIPMPVFEHGFAAIEPELVIELGLDRDSDRMFIGAEIASSPVPAINSYGPAAVVCDFGNNNGLLIGAEIAAWQEFGDQVEVNIWIDEELVGHRILGNLAADALAARDFCIAHARQCGSELPPGTLVSTGAITGVHEAAVGAEANISFGPLGTLGLALIDAKPVNELIEGKF